MKFWFDKLFSFNCLKIIELKLLLSPQVGILSLLEDSIVSINVEPDLGKPIIKIGLKWEFFLIVTLSILYFFLLQNFGNIFLKYNSDWYSIFVFALYKNSYAFSKR